MADNFVFSDELIDIQQDFDQWEPAPEFAPPPPAGNYRFYLSKLHDEGNNKPMEKETKVGKRLFVVVDTRIVGGEYDDRSVNFQRLNNVDFADRTGKRRSFMLDLLKSSGLQQAPRNNNEFYQAIKSLVDRGTGATIGGQLDWEGTCPTCRDRSLLRSTGAGDVKVAKESATKEQWDEARKASVKAKNHRGFPLLENGTRKDSFICVDCGNEVRAQASWVRFMP